MNEENIMKIYYGKQLITIDSYNNNLIMRENIHLNEKSYQK